jgi:hypothetical protein
MYNLNILNEVTNECPPGSIQFNAAYDICELRGLDPFQSSNLPSGAWISNIQRVLLEARLYQLTNI